MDFKYPTWDGDWNKWTDYQLRVELRADGLKEDDQKLLGPRLASNLTGKAFDSLAEIDREKLRQPDGWQYFLRFLEKTQGREKVDLLGDAFNEFFVRKEVYRKDGEEFSEYEPRFRSLTRRLEKALKESGSEGKLPTEVLGWFLLNCYMRMDPSDIANVRGRSESYKLEHVVASLQKMWSGGGLAAKDQEMRRRQKDGGQALLVDEPSRPDEGEVYQNVDEDVMESHAATNDEELEELATWYQEAYVALVDEPDDTEILANFKDARRALDQARTARGFYPVRHTDSQKGRGKSQGKGNDNRDNEYANKTCIRCGKRGHIARICPQRAQSDGKGQSGKGSGKVGFVGVQWQEPTAENACDKGDECAQVWASTGHENQLRGKAVLDSGASDNVIGVNTLQDLADMYEDLCLNTEDEFEIDRNIHKSFVYGGDHSSKALALAHLNLGVLGNEMMVDVHVVEGSTPLLLSAKFLYDSRATIDFRKGTAVFEGINHEAYQLERSPGNHLLLPVTVFGGRRGLMRSTEMGPPAVPVLSAPESDPDPKGDEPKL